jgi:dTDP-4-dehydrorhamnose 3,5-epimerase
MKVIETRLPGVLIVEPDIYGDARGYFLETWQRQRYAAHGITEDFVQDNLSFSQRGVLRGLHAQHPHGQGKLVQVMRGEVFDVAVDIRNGSPHFGQWVGVDLSGDNKRQFFIPPGFAHGFCVVSDEALFGYKCTDFYQRDCEFSIRWDDPAIGIQWPVSSPSLSEKDSAAPLLEDLAVDRLPPFTPG